MRVPDGGRRQAAEREIDNSLEKTLPGGAEFDECSKSWVDDCVQLLRRPEAQSAAFTRQSVLASTRETNEVPIQKRIGFEKS